MQETLKIEQPNIGLNFGSVTINNYYPQPVADSQPKKEEKENKAPDFFCVSERFPEENIRERLDTELKQAANKVDYCRALYTLQHMGCINIHQYASDAQRAHVFNNYQDRFNLSPDDFYRARLNRKR